MHYNELALAMAALLASTEAIALQEKRQWWGSWGGFGWGSQTSAVGAPTESLSAFPTLTGGFGPTAFSISAAASTETPDPDSDDDDDDDDDDSDDSSTAVTTSFPTTFETVTAPTATSTSDGDDDDDDDSEPSTSASETGSSAPAETSSSSSSGGSSTSASTTFPDAAGESTLSEPMVVSGTFDGNMYRFGRGVDCTGQDEGGDSDAVFEIEEGGVLKNVIIGSDQIEGIHCMGACTLENVWWEAVCEDALTIKQESGVSYVNGGGAKGADDKVIQHNGGGTVSVSGFYVSGFGKLYRSCGNCDDQYERHVIIDGVIADDGSVLAGINSNYGDTATITNSCVTNVDTICAEYEGNDTGDEPEEISSGISSSCIYTDADVSSC